MKDIARIASKFFDRMDIHMEDPQITWNDSGESVEIILDCEDFQYSFTFRDISELEEHEKIGKCHTALAEAIEEVDEDEN